MRYFPYKNHYRVFQWPMNVGRSAISFSSSTHSYSASCVSMSVLRRNPFVNLNVQAFNNNILNFVLSSIIQVLIRCKDGRRWCKCGDGTDVFYSIRCGGNFPVTNCGTPNVGPLPDEIDDVSWGGSRKKGCAKDGGEGQLNLGESEWC